MQDKLKLKDVPRRFIIRADSPEIKDLQFRDDKYGVFMPDGGYYIIISEERGIDEFLGCPEDVKWIDE
jgi:hypothetical protein